MRILISAGPTQEPIDDVRFITNASSGRMGLALARAAVRKGHAVTVVLGPVAATPKLEGARIVPVRTAAEMADAVLSELAAGADVFIAAAAVGDYAPEKTARGKISSARTMVLRLKPTRKITLLAKKKFPDVFVAAFKAEFNVPEKELINRAKSKLSKEKLDVIAANDIGRNRMGSLENKIYVISRDGIVLALGPQRKSVLARRLLKAITACFLAQSSP